MKKSENSTDKIMQNIALIIFIAAYVGICGFVIVKINGERRSELINSQFTGEELIKKQGLYYNLYINVCYECFNFI